MKLRLLILGFCSLFFSQLGVHALTVEAVLRGLQERYIVYKKSSTWYDTSTEPIEWPGGIPAMPQDGTIQDLPKAIAALNHASKVFDQISPYYIAFDIENQRFINIDAEADYSAENTEWDTTETEENWIAGNAGGGARKSPSSIQLESVGDFTESNWRQKLVKLASNIEQLKVLNWGYKAAGNSAHSRIFYYDWTDTHTAHRLYESIEDGHRGHFYHEPIRKGLETQLQFPHITNEPVHDHYPNCTYGNGVTNRSPGSRIGFGSRIVGLAFDGDGEDDFAYTDKDDSNHPNYEYYDTYDDQDYDGEIKLEDGGEGEAAWAYGGFNGYFDTGCDHYFHTQFSSGNLNLAGTIVLFQSPSINAWGDLTEGYAKEGLTRFTNISSGNSITMGIEELDPYIPWPTGIPSSTPGRLGYEFRQAVDASLGIFDIPSITGELVLGPEVSQEEIENTYTFDDGSSVKPYIFQVANEPQNRRGFLSNGLDSEAPTASIHALSVEAFPVAIPTFTTILSTTEKSKGILSQKIGEVSHQVRYNQPVKIYVGRGHTDKNQEAWLSVRSDGFGSMEFCGSPNAFVLDYEENFENYTDEPLGGKTYDTTYTFTTSQGQQSGWGNRFAYFSHWLMPRLLSVKGGDVQVDITYINPYKKTLSFFWLTGGAKSATAFKTIQIENPTMESGLPTVKNQLSVTEIGGRAHKILHTPPDLANNYAESITFQLGVSINSPYQTVQLDLPAYTQSPRYWTHVFTTGNVTSTSVSDGIIYNSSFLPPSFAETSVGSETGKIDIERYENNPSHPDLRKSVKQLTFSGGNLSSNETWQEGGKQVSKIVKWASNGLLESEKYKFGGKMVEVSYGWSGNTRTTTSKLDGQTFRTEQAVYSSDFNTVTQKIDGETVATVQYNGTNYSQTIPSGLQTITSSSTANDHNLSVNVAGITTTTKVTRFGELINHSISSGGTVLSQAIGEDFTDWGAPRKLTHLRGTTDITYTETGINWGARTSVKNPYNVTSGQGFDWLGRLSSFSNGYESFTADLSDLLKSKVTSNAGYTLENTFTAFGKLTNAKRTVTGNGLGVSSELSLNTNGADSLTVDGRTRSIETDTSGFLASIGSGAGSRGAQMNFGVDSTHGLYTETTPRTKTGDPRSSSAKVRTYYDQRGRVKRMEYPNPANNGGSTLADTWTYDDTARSVTYTPAAGPLAQTITTTLSADGGTVTLKKGGYELMKKIRSGATVILQINDDSNGTPVWKEVSRTAINPSAGTLAFTPWELSSNGVTIASGAPGAQTTTTITDAASGDTKTITLQNGLPAAISGTDNGVNVSINNIAHNAGVMTGISGTIGGQAVGFALDSKLRPASYSGPGSSGQITYGGGSGFSISTSDSTQITSKSFTLDAVGDATEVSGDGIFPLNMATTDTAEGSQTAINSSVTFKNGLLGQLREKDYAGGIDESHIYNADGSLDETTIYGEGNTTTIDVNETPTSRSVAYSDTSYSSASNVSISETFSNVGTRSNVNATNDARTFNYKRLALEKETHTSGPWSGWTVEYLQDTKGRLGNIRVSGPGIIPRNFEVQYDAHSRIAASKSDDLTATYGTRSATGQLTTLSRGVVNTTWSYDSGASGTNRLTGITNDNTGSNGLDFNFSYPSYDSRHRIQTREANYGIGWSNLTYDNRDQLEGADLSNGRDLSYDYDAAGNRTDEENGSLNPNGLNQITGRTLSERSFILVGEVNPDALLKTKHPFAQNPDPNGWEELLVDVNSGLFGKLWTVPNAFNNGDAVRIDADVRGTLEDAGVNGADAVAEETISLFVPPVNEVFDFDGAGRMKEDAYWTYTWDAAGRLIKLTRKEEVLPPAATGETVDFVYDADGRRTKKTRTITYNNSPSKVWENKMLWAGWLPVLEVRTKDGAFVDRRWFQWGVDISGSLDGAGGIGGLVAIIEEKAFGGVRTLLPVHDGLGNVAAVIDRATGKTVARYNHGPFGEVLGESGEADVCPFRYQTKYFDKESEHYYFGYRYYNPRLGRWLSRDPLGEAGGFNLYSYCENDPVNKHDPLGLESVHWHHLFTAARAEDLLGLGIDVDLPQFGMFFKESLHLDELHLGNSPQNPGGLWNQVWEKEFWDKTGHLNDTLRKEAAMNFMHGLFEDPRFKETLSKGAPIPPGFALRYADFHKYLTPHEKGRLISASYRYAKYLKFLGVGVSKAWSATKSLGGKVAKKAIPVVPIFFLSQDVEARGFGGGLLNSGLDAIPFVGWSKLAIESSLGEDIVQTTEQIELEKQIEAISQSAHSRKILIGKRQFQLILQGGFPAERYESSREKNPFAP